MRLLLPNRMSIDVTIGELEQLTPRATKSLVDLTAELAAKPTYGASPLASVRLPLTIVPLMLPCACASEVHPKPAPDAAPSPAPAPSA